MRHLRLRKPNPEIYRLHRQFVFGKDPKPVCLESVFSSSCGHYQQTVSICQQQTDKQRAHNERMDTLAERLRREREAKGWSQPELARRSGVKQSFIGALEAHNQVSSSYLPELARALGVDCYWLKTGKGRRAGSSLTHDEQTIIEAFPLLDPAVREIWLQSANSAIERHKGNGAMCA